jgi:hypothetical protein
MSHCQETRFKDFLFNPKWISYQISSFFALIDALQVILFQLLFLLPEISKLKFSKTKSPRIDPFVSFPFNMLRNRRKNRQRTEREKSDGRSSERKKESSLGTG